MKRKALFLVAAMALTAAALVSGPPAAEAAPCRKPLCFASPGCCLNWECDDWCGGSGLGRCSGGGQGGCCYCPPPES
jgi:hypothetical protein